jgi:hypothetical protein
MNMDPNLEDLCTCHLTGDDPHCPLHGEAIQFAGIPDLQALFGTRAVPNALVAALPSTPTGRIIDGGTVSLRPYEPKGDTAFNPHIALNDANAHKLQLRHDIAAACHCDQPATFGHDADCVHGAVQPAPLQLLIAAAQLISDQPTTEQWKIIKKAIRDLVPSP